MIKILDENPQVGMVCGNRFNGNVDKKALRRVFRAGNRFLAFAHRTLNGVALEDPLTGLRVIRTELLREWDIKSKGFDIEVEMNNFVQRKGYATREILIDYRARLGEKKLRARDGFTILWRILKDVDVNRQIFWRLSFFMGNNFLALAQVARRAFNWHATA